MWQSFESDMVLDVEWHGFEFDMVSNVARFRIWHSFEYLTWFQIWHSLELDMISNVA